jgi:hypothetical protein
MVAGIVPRDREVRRRRAIDDRRKDTRPPTLTPFVLVRIQVPQPYNQVILPHFVSFRLRRNSSDMSAGYSPSITMVRFQRRKTAAFGARRREMSLRPVFDPSHVEHCARSARRQAGANPRSRRCSCQSCGRVLESMTSRVGVSSTGCWPTKIARTISGER